MKWRRSGVTCAGARMLIAKWLREPWSIWGILEMFLYVDCGGMYLFVKTHWASHLKWVHFIVYKLHPNNTALSLVHLFKSRIALIEEEITQSPQPSTLLVTLRSPKGPWECPVEIYILRKLFGLTKLLHTAINIARQSRLINSVRSAHFRENHLSILAKGWLRSSNEISDESYHWQEKSSRPAVFSEL